MNNGMHNLSVLQQKTNTAVEATGGMEATEAGEKREGQVCAAITTIPCVHYRSF